MYLYLSCVMISVVCVRLHVISPMVSFHHRNYFSPFCGRTKIRDIYGQKKFRRLPLIFTHQFSPTTLTDTHSYTRTNTHSNSPVWFHPTISTHALSLTNFIHLFSPTFFHLPFFTLSFFTLTDSFHPLCRRNQFSRTILCALVSPTCRFHLLVDIIYLQISYTCTCLVDWCFLSFFLSWVSKAQPNR